MGLEGLSGRCCWSHRRSSSSTPRPKSASSRPARGRHYGVGVAGTTTAPAGRAARSPQGSPELRLPSVGTTLASSQVRNKPHATCAQTDTAHKHVILRSWLSVCTACALRTQRLGYSPKNTCHLFTSTAKQQSPHQNNKTAFSLVIKCRYEQANQPYKVQLCKGMQDAHIFKFEHCVKLLTFMLTSTQS